MADRPYMMKKPEGLKGIMPRPTGGVMDVIAASRGLTPPVSETPAEPSFPAPSQKAAPAVSPASDSSLVSPAPGSADIPVPVPGAGAPGETPGEAVWGALKEEAGRVTGPTAGIQAPFQKALKRRFTEKKDAAAAEQASRELFLEAKRKLGKEGLRTLMAGTEQLEGEERTVEMNRRLQEWKFSELGVDVGTSLVSTPAGPAIPYKDIQAQAFQSLQKRYHDRNPFDNPEELDQRAWHDAQEEVDKTLMVATGLLVTHRSGSKLAKGLTDALGPLAPLAALLWPSTSDVTETGRLSMLDDGTKGMLQWVLDAAPSTIIGAGLATAKPGEEHKRLAELLGAPAGVGEAALMAVPLIGQAYWASKLADTWNDPEITKAVLEGENLVTQYDTFGKALIQAAGAENTKHAALLGGIATAGFLLVEPDLFLAAGPLGKLGKARAVAKAVKVANGSADIVSPLTNVEKVRSFLDSPEGGAALVDQIRAADATTRTLFVAEALSAIEKSGNAAFSTKLRQIVEEANSADEKISALVSELHRLQTDRPEMAEEIATAMAWKTQRTAELAEEAAADAEQHLEFMWKVVGRKSQPKRSATYYRMEIRKAIDEGRDVDDDIVMWRSELDGVEREYKAAERLYEDAFYAETEAADTLAAAKTAEEALKARKVELDTGRDAYKAGGKKKPPGAKYTEYKAKRKELEAEVERAKGVSREGAKASRAKWTKVRDEEIPAQRKAELDALQSQLARAEQKGRTVKAEKLRRDITAVEAKWDRALKEAKDILKKTPRGVDTANTELVTAKKALERHDRSFAQAKARAEAVYTSGYQRWKAADTAKTQASKRKTAATSDRVAAEALKKEAAQPFKTMKGELDDLAARKAALHKKRAELGINFRIAQQARKARELREFARAQKVNVRTGRRVLNKVQRKGLRITKKQLRIAKKLQPGAKLQRQRMTRVQAAEAIAGAARRVEDSLRMVTKEVIEGTATGATKLRRAKLPGTLLGRASDEPGTVNRAKLEAEMRKVYGDAAFEEWLAKPARGGSAGQEYVVKAFLKGTDDTRTMTDLESKLFSDGLGTAQAMLQAGRLEAEGMDMASAWLQGFNDLERTWRDHGWVRRALAWFEVSFDATRLDLGTGVSDTARRAAETFKNRDGNIGTDIADMQNSSSTDDEFFSKMIQYFTTTEKVSTKRGGTKVNTNDHMTQWERFRSILGDVIRAHDAAKARGEMVEPLGENSLIKALANAYLGRGPEVIASQDEALKATIKVLREWSVEITVRPTSMEDAMRSMEQKLAGLAQGIARVEPASVSATRTRGALYNVIRFGSNLHYTREMFTKWTGGLDLADAQAVNNLYGHAHHGNDMKRALSVLNRLGMSPLAGKLETGGEAPLANRIINMGLATDGTQYFMPDNMLRMFQREFNSKLKEREALGRKSESYVGRQLLRFAKYYKTSVVAGFLLPDWSYQVGNVGFSDAWLLFRNLGPLGALKVSANTLPAALPYFNRTFGAGGMWNRMAQGLKAKFGDVPVLGSVTNAFMNPVINRVMRGEAGTWVWNNELYSTARVQAELVDLGILDNVVSEELMSAVDKASRGFGGNFFQRAEGRLREHQHDLQQHAQLIAQRQRVGMYIELRERGMTATEAAAEVKDALYDWGHAVSQRELEFSLLSGVFFYRFFKLSMRQGLNTLMEPLIKGMDEDYVKRALTGRSHMARTRQTYYAQRAMAHWQFGPSDPTEEEHWQLDMAEYGRTFARPEWIEATRFGRTIPLGPGAQDRIFTQEAGRRATHVHMTTPEPPNLGAVALWLNTVGAAVAWGAIEASNRAGLSSELTMRRRWYEVPLVELTDQLHPSFGRVASHMANARASGQDGRMPISPGMARTLQGVSTWVPGLDDIGEISQDYESGRLMANESAVSLVRLIPTLLQAPRLADDVYNPLYGDSYAKGVAATLAQLGGIGRMYPADPTEVIDKTRGRLERDLQGGARGARSKRYAAPELSMDPRKD